MWRYTIPLSIFIIMAIFLGFGLRHNPQQLPCVMLNKPAPEFAADNLLHPGQTVHNNLFIGHVSLLNVWATWCITCQMEHPILMDIAHQVKIYGLNYKDDPRSARTWLQQHGNPYAVVIADPQGLLGIDWGVYGTPETFIIDPQGVIRYKYVGAISPEVWREELAPLVKKWSKS